jgi:hypothetical protein
MPLKIGMSRGGEGREGKGRGEREIDVRRTKKAGEGFGGVVAEGL